MCQTELGGVIGFLIPVLIGMAFVSIHYRKRYEKLRDMLKRHFDIEADDLEI